MVSRSFELRVHLICWGVVTFDGNIGDMRDRRCYEITNDDLIGRVMLKPLGDECIRQITGKGPAGTGAGVDAQDTAHDDRLVAIDLASYLPKPIPSEIW